MGTQVIRYGRSSAAILLVLWLSACAVSPRSENVGEVSHVYKRYLEFAEPTGGIVPQFNPPVLRWPRTSGKDVVYDIRLSRDSLFREGAITAEQHAWAMFNPHEKLGEGNWYWQYRVSSKDWSPRQHFVITSDVPSLVSPTPSAFLERIPSEHPRVLTEVSDLRSLRARAETDDARAIIREADDFLKVTIPQETDGVAKRKSEDAERQRKFEQEASKRLGDFAAAAVKRLAEAYLLSGDNTYRNRAMEIARAVAGWDPDGVTSSAYSDFSDARCMLALALAYDTFYDAFNEQERALLRQAIHVRADRFYRSWRNNIEVRLLSGHVWQHILHYFFQSALALHGDHPAADEWLGYAYSLFLARTPVLGGKDGGWIEGVSYFTMNMETVLEIPFYIRKYTGFDFFREHPWYVNNIDWMIYHIPPGSSADGFGDNTEEIFSPGAAFPAYADALAKLTGDARASWYARACEKYESPDYASSSLLRWFRLAHIHDLPTPDPVPPTEDMGKVFKEIGIVSLHTNPLNTPENLAVAMRSSPYGCYGHFLADQNSFNILYGGRRTFFRTGYKVAMTDPHRTGWYQQTKSTNSVLADGHGQPCSTESYAMIRYFAEGDGLAYAMGDASRAYTSEETGDDVGVKKFLRHLILIKPDIVVIYDELEANRPVAWSWLIHSMTAIAIDSANDTFQSDFGFARGYGKLLASGETNWAVADTFDVPAVNWRGSRTASGDLKKYDDEQWHLMATTKGRSEQARFLAVLRVGPESEAVIPGDGKKAREGSLVVGDVTIEASLEAGRPAGMKISRGRKTIFEYEADRRPVVSGKEAQEVLPYDISQRMLQ